MPERIECHLCAADTVHFGPSPCYCCKDCHGDDDANRIECSFCGAEGVSFTRRQLSRSSDYFCQRCYDQQYVECANCDQEIRTDDAYTTPQEDSVCCECFHTNYFICPGCRQTFYQDNGHEHDDETYCEYCLPRDDHITAKPFRPRSITFDEIRSTRTFGVELETHECEGFTDLDGQTHFSSKEDGSIQGEEFVSVVLQGDQGLESIRDFCRAARSFKVNSDCGFHLHLGVADLSDDSKMSVCAAYKLTERIWRSFVPSSRQRSSYCIPINWDLHRAYAELDHWKLRNGATFFSCWVSHYTRYQWFNPSAILAHNTFEIRLHTATLNAVKVCNWVKAHARFLDAVAKLNQLQVQAAFGLVNNNELFHAVTRLWDDAQLTEFYRQRALAFGTPYHAAPAAPTVAPLIGECELVA